MSTFLSKICDSAQDSHVAPSFSKGGHKVGDAFNGIASYADVAEALSSCHIGYSLDDYRIWADALSLDNHGTEDRLTITLFADGFDDKNDESSMEAYYDEFGIDNFYHNFAITTLGVHIKEKGAWDDLVVDCYVPTASITAEVVSRLVNAICFCYEEHCSLSEALQHLKESVPELLFELQISVEDIQQKFGEDVGYLDLPVSSAVSEKDSFYNKSAWGASESDITRIISESNPVLEYLGGGSGVMGKSLTFAIKGMEDVSYIDIPVTKTTTLRELSDLISPDNLEFPSEVSDSVDRNSRFGDSWLIRNMSDSGIRNFLHHLLPGTNPAIKFKGVHRKGDGSSGLLIFNLREGGVNYPITIPFTATTSAFDLKELIDPDNLEHPAKGEFPSEVSDSSKRVKDEDDGWSYDESTPFHFAVYTKESVLGKPISSISVFVDHDDAGIAHHRIDVEGLRGYVPVDILDILESSSLPDLEDAQELAELIMESYNDFYAKVYDQMYDLVL